MVVYAQATPRGSSALAVMRLAGSGSPRMVERLMRLPAGRLAGMRRAVGRVHDAEGPVDGVVALSWPEGRSYTGEEMVELICHGVQERLDRLARLLESEGALPAEPGELTRRAWISGRMSSMDVLELADAWRGEWSGPPPGEEARRLEGDLEALHEDLAGSIELGERHGGGLGGEELMERLSGLAARAGALGDRIASIACSPRLVLAGPFNAGKSTLFNRLVGRRMALVSEQPGTTRDGRSAPASLGGLEVELLDTAGYGGSGLDAEAFALFLEGLRESDVVVWMSPGASLEPPPALLDAAGRVVRVASRCDQSPAPDAAIGVSGTTGEGVARLGRSVAELVRLRGGETLLQAVEEGLEDAAGAMGDGDWALSAQMTGEALELLRNMTDGSGCLERAVEGALARMCAGK